MGGSVCSAYSGGCGGGDGDGGGGDDNKIVKETKETITDLRVDATDGKILLRCEVWCFRMASAKCCLFHPVIFMPLDSKAANLLMLDLVGEGVRFKMIRNIKYQIRTGRKEETLTGTQNRARPHFFGRYRCQISVGELLQFVENQVLCGFEYMTNNCTHFLQKFGNRFLGNPWGGWTSLAYAINGPRYRNMEIPCPLQERNDVNYVRFEQQNGDNDNENENKNDDDQPQERDNADTNENENEQKDDNQPQQRNDIDDDTNTNENENEQKGDEDQNDNNNDETKILFDILLNAEPKDGVKQEVAEFDTGDTW